MNKILSNRLTFAQSVDEAYNEAGIFAKLFGIGYISHPDSKLNITKSVEMDFFSVFYRHGVIGLIVYVLPLFAFFIYILIFVFKNLNKAYASWKLCTYFVQCIGRFGIAFMAQPCF